MSVSLTSARITLNLSWNVQATQTGAPATVNSGSWSPSLSYTNGSGAGQASDYVQVINTLAGGANSTYDLTSTFADLVGTSSVNMATVRMFVIWLLSSSQTGPDGSTVGTTATSITVGGAASSQAFTAATPAGFFGSAAYTFNVPNGGWAGFGVANAGGYTAGATYSKLKVLNNDGSNTATFALTFANS